MNRIIATIAIATATVTGFAAPSFAGLLSGAEKAQVERMTGDQCQQLECVGPGLHPRADCQWRAVQGHQRQPYTRRDR